MDKSFLSVAACAVTLVSFAFDVSLPGDGSVRLSSEIELRPLVAPPNWKGPGAGWAKVGTEAAERPDGRLAVKATVTALRDAPEGLGAVGFVVDLPREKAVGRVWRADEVGGRFPEACVERKLGSGSARVIAMPFDRELELIVESERPLGYYVQDNAVYGGKSISFRLGDVAAPRKARKGETWAYAFTLAVVKPLETPWTRPFEIVRGETWAALDYLKEIVPGSALDFSRFGGRDAPAGKYGWLRADGERLVFERRPQVAQRFYGVNLCGEACFPKDAADAERIVTRICSQGYNAIRLHHHDRQLVEGSADGVTLNPRRADRLDRLVAAAIAHGLYVTTDMFISRDVPYRQIGIDRDGLVNMQVYKSLTDLHEPAFRDWAAFSRNFFEHVNPYTGRAYRDEPAMPLVSLINEGGLFMGWWYTGKTEEPVIVEAWRRWVTEMRAADPSFHPEVSPDVVPKTPYDRKYSAPFAMFQADVEARGAAKRMAFLRSIGVKALLTSDNSGPHWAPLQATAKALDYVDDHFYQDHPQFVGQRWSLPTTAPCPNPVQDPRLQCCTSPYTRLAGKPFTVTEFAFSSPSPYRAQGGLLTGALAALQDWSGLWHFAYGGEGDLRDNRGHIGFFTVASDPISLASDKAILALFLRGDMDALPREKGVSLLITPEAVAPEGTAAFYSYPSWSADACWKRRVSSCLRREDAGTETVIPRERAEDPAMKALACDVPEDPRVRFDRAAGTFAVDTPRTCGGFAPAGKAFVAGKTMSCTVFAADATVWATALDGRAISESARILVTHLTDAQNEGARFKDGTFRRYLSTGSRPLVRTGRAEIALSVDAPAACRVYALRTNGVRKGEVKTLARDGRLVFTAEIVVTDPTLHYEIVCANE